MKKIVILLAIFLSFASAKPADLQARLVNGVLVVNQPILFIDRKDGVVFSWCFEDTKIEGFKKSLPKRGKLKIKAPGGDINKLCGNVQPLQSIVETKETVETIVDEILNPLKEILTDKDLSKEDQMEAFLLALEDPGINKIYQRDLKGSSSWKRLSTRSIKIQLDAAPNKRDSNLLKVAIKSWLIDYRLGR